uniref:PIN domain-containing protein n=1 Tax=Mycena chlorophos TaxID=658473 RepID=A0ABQ0L8X6_MYCCL|nr:predicted protein [Mycena chlorophos]
MPWPSKSFPAIVTGDRPCRALAPPRLLREADRVNSSPRPPAAEVIALRLLEAPRTGSDATGWRDGRGFGTWRSRVRGSSERVAEALSVRSELDTRCRRRAGGPATSFIHPLLSYVRPSPHMATHRTAHPLAPSLHIRRPNSCLSATCAAHRKRGPTTASGCRDDFSSPRRLLVVTRDRDIWVDCKRHVLLGHKEAGALIYVPTSARASSPLTQPGRPYSPEQHSSALASECAVRLGDAAYAATHALKAMLLRPYSVNLPLYNYLWLLPLVLQAVLLCYTSES